MSLGNRENWSLEKGLEPKLEPKYMGMDRKPEPKYMGMDPKLEPR